MSTTARSNKNSTSASTDNRAERPSRVPLYEQRNQLTLKDKDDGLVYRFVNDKSDRIYKFQRAGWEHVTTKHMEVGDYEVEPHQELGNVICRQVNSDGTKAYLMCLPKELYNEDQARKQEENDRLEEAMEEETKKQAEGLYGEMNVSVSR